MLFKKKKEESSQPKRNARSLSEAYHGGSHDESNWLVSYADMMTLLCGFFIMLFSMAKLDNAQYDSFKSALVKQFGGQYVSSTQELAFFASQIIQELGVEKKAIIKTDAYGISVIFESAVFFQTSASELTAEGNRIIGKFIEKIRERQKATAKTYKIVAEGHSDSRPIVAGPYPSNWELSAARATRVIRMFLNAGYPGNQLTAIGFADTRPQTTERTSSGSWNFDAMAKNRRAVLRILEPSADVIPLPENDKAMTVHPTDQKTIPAAKPAH